MCIATMLIEIILQKTRIIPEIMHLRPRNPKSAYQLSENPVLGYSLKPNFRSKTPDLTETFSYINAHGQRDTERNLTKSPDTTRIVIIGDSVVAGHGIADVNNTITKQLEKLLHPYRIEVLNFGVGGYSTIGEIELLKTKALHFSPDMVILLYVHNDIYNINTQIHNYLPKNLSLFQKAYLHLASVRFISCILNINPYTHILENHYAAIGKESLDKSIKTFKTLAEENSFTPCVILWPTFSKKSLVSRKKRMQDIADSTANQNIPLWDLKSYMEKHLDFPEKIAVQKHLTVGDNMHPNEEGAKIAAMGIKDILIENFADILKIKQS